MAQLVSPQCSSWSLGSNFNFSGSGRAVPGSKFDVASTVTANPLDNDSNSGFYEAVLSPIPTVHEQVVHHRSRRNSALLVNYFTAGLFHSVVPALVYPLFKIRLGLQGYQANSVQTLLGCAWHGKLLLCLLTDCVPICGHRRTPYIYIGWVLVLSILSLMMILHPDIMVDSDVGDAPRLILAITAASVGYLLVDSACDGLMVETMYRDSQLEERGLFRTASLSQSAVHTVRFIAELIGTLLVAVGMNSEEYNGGFPFEISLRELLLVLIVVASIALVTTAWSLYEPRSTQPEFVGDIDTFPVAFPKFLRSKLGEFWRIMQQRATWQIASFGFLQKMSLSFGVDSASPSQAIHEFWLDTDPLTKNLFLALTNGGVCVAASVFVHRRLLSTSWHSSVCIGLLGGLITGFSVAMMMVFDVWRSKFFFLVANQIVAFTDCIAMVVRMLVVVEIAEPGFESSTYGLVTSVYNLADPVATALNNAIGAYFRVFDADIQQDADDVRIRAGALFAALFTVRAVVGLGAIPLLPNQKHNARELKTQGGSSKSMALTVFGSIGVGFIVALVANILSIFQSTSCLRFAGGVGC
ncbi:hypothetical protein F441_01018 [Phytophthora nicotianae CJ01A1]|uniref:Transmembrane protein n=3 Tax=Phytophthora nicotianae TaxID=4792 RepID=W3A3I4_PHYNI|nr:hypothetical protein L915_00981 [Phytophthora nicotianae]ETP26199.1 hypothetical protein F441_01018 [Phytophthora nicotianae CJ01A1]ETP54182.1 hypothetical protein F442_00992 [Phytophthora nicotianae P10297]